MCYSFPIMDGNSSKTHGISSKMHGLEAIDILKHIKWLIYSCFIVFEI